MEEKVAVADVEGAANDEGETPGSAAVAVVGACGVENEFVVEDDYDVVVVAAAASLQHAAVVAVVVVA